MAVPESPGPQAGPSQARYWGSSVGLPFDSGCVSNPGEQAFSGLDLGMEGCITESSLRHR